MQCMGFWSLISSRLNLNPTFLRETAKGLGQVISFVAHRNLRCVFWVRTRQVTWCCITATRARAFNLILSLRRTKVSSDTLPYPNLAHTLSRHVMRQIIPT
jgi:hypothetical protein